MTFTRYIAAHLPRPAFNLRFLLALLAVLVLAAEPALAQNLDPLESMLQTVVDALTGPIGRLIAILTGHAVGTAARSAVQTAIGLAQKSAAKR